MLAFNPASVLLCVLVILLAIVATVSAPIPPKPTYLAINPAGVPEEVKALKQWILWKPEWRADKKGSGRWTKKPKNAKGLACAAATKPGGQDWSKDWIQFKEAYGASQTPYMKQNRGIAGVGFVLTGTPYSGVDFDHCVENGTIPPDVIAWLRKFNSYAEISVSGTGVHILCRGKKEIDAKLAKSIKKSIEIYSEGRYFTFTGHHVEGTPMTINDAQGALDELYNFLFGDVAKKVPAKESPVKELTNPAPAVVNKVFPASMDDRIKSMRWQWRLFLDLENPLDILKFREQTAHEGWLYYKGLFAEAQACGIKHPELYPILKQTQPDFDPTDCDKRIAEHGGEGNICKPYKRETMDQYFPPAVIIGMLLSSLPAATGELTNAILKKIFLCLDPSDPAGVELAAVTIPQLKKITGKSKQYLDKLHRAVRKEIKTLAKRTSLPSTKTENAKKILEISGGNETSYVMTPTGIIIETTRYDKDGNAMFKEEPAFTWNSFEIVSTCDKPSYYGEESTYTFHLNGKTYRNRIIKELKEIVVNAAMVGITNKSNLLNKIIVEYVKARNVPNISYAPICGFTEKGWVLPHTHEIGFSRGIQDEIAENILAMATMAVDPTQARDHMKALYDAVTVKRRDIVFAYAMIAPFEYALQPITGLMFNLALHSPKGQTGKTKLMKAVSTTWWNNLGSDLLTAANFNLSRGEDYLSSSTFIVPIDECDKIDDRTLALIKSYLTGRFKVQKKNTNQTLATNRYLTNPQMHTFNEFPSIYDDPRVRERTLVVEMNGEPFTAEESTKFNAVLNMLSPGEIGHYIYEQTQKWTLTDLKEIYENIDDILGSTDSRSNAIYKLLRLGACLMEKLFGITLNLEEIPELIKQTKQGGNEAVFSLIIDQIHISDETDWQGHEVCITDKDGNATGQKKRVFDSRMNANRWVDSEVKIVKHASKETLVEAQYYKYTHNNLKDLIKVLPRRLQTLTLPELATRLQTQWEGVEYAHTKKGWFVFIPINNIPEEGDE